MKNFLFGIIFAFTAAMLVVVPAVHAADANYGPSASDANYAPSGADTNVTSDPGDAAVAPPADNGAPDQYFVVRITSGATQTANEVGGQIQHIKTYKGVITNGSDSGREVDVTQNDLFLSNRAIQVSIGDKVVVVETTGPDGTVQYLVTDAYRIPSLWWAALAFFLLALVFGRMRGFTSVLGLLASAGIIVFYVVPKIANGGDPLWTSLSASVAIATVSLFLAHGFNKRTGVAYAGTILTLLISAFVAIQTVAFTHLFGMGSEDSLFVLGDFPNISLQGLLLGGIMLGLLGVLDDITTAQSAVVDELKRANPSLDFKELYRRGLSVGREHIASLINTLFLAYAGASLPLFLLFSTGQGTQLWTIFNNEMVAEEIVRTLVGSACLVLAVPITTALAAYAYRHAPSGQTGKGHTH